MDGAEVLTAHPQVAVILLSGYVDPDFEQQMGRLGATRVLPKTFLGRNPGQLHPRCGG